MAYWILKEIKVVDYEFNIPDTWFNTLEKLRLAQDNFFGKYMRILALDEGNELHRQNWSDPEVEMFFQRLRRERYEQRLTFVCIPVLGEMKQDIVQNRVNFVHEMVNTADKKTGSLNKGRCNFYIVPRSKNIYSPKHRKNLQKSEIKTLLFENMKDKNFLKGIDGRLLLKTYPCNGVWGHPQYLYNKYLKDTNKNFKVKGSFKGLTDSELYAFYKSGLKPKMVGVSKEMEIYSGLTKAMHKIKKYFEANADIVHKLESEQEIASNLKKRMGKVIEE